MVSEVLGRVLCQVGASNDEGALRVKAGPLLLEKEVGIEEDC